MKKVLRSGVILGLIVSLILFSAPTFAADQGNAQNFALDHILVKFKAGTDEATKQEVHGRHGGSVIDDIARLGVQVVKIPAGKVREKVGAYSGEKAVQFAEPDFVAEAIGVPDDAYFFNQWGMTKIQAPQAWDVTTGNSNIKIAILDTGVDQNHEDLASKILANKNFTTSTTVDDRYGHGTHVAGIAAATTNNGIGVAGVGYNSTIMNGKVLGDTGSGYYSWVANGITWAADNGAKVISMSLGGSSPSSTLENAINYAWGKGVVIVAAAGNSYDTTPQYPAYYNNCIAVAATDNNDVKASFSTYGTWVDVAAPGVAIFSTLPNHSNKIGTTNYGSLSGTSMATPHVAGLAGLVWATAYGTNNTNVRSRIESTADAIVGTGTYWQYGRINAYKAVAPAAPQPPSLSVSVLAPSLTNQKSFTVQATVTNSGGVTAIGVTATIKLPSGLSTTESLTKSLRDIAGKTSMTASWSVTAEADGTYTITVDAAATNASTASGTATVTVDTTPPTLSNIAAGNITSSLADITWTTNESSDSRVDYGTTSGTYTSSVYNGQLVTSHKVTLTNLQTSTTYYYRVTSVDSGGNKAVSGELSFTTTTGPTPDFSISASPSSRSVWRGASTSYTVTLTALSGYSLPVKFTVSGLPSSATYTFSTNPVTPTSSGATSTLTVITSRNQVGTYTLTITGTGTDTASTIHSTTVTLRIR